MTTQQAIEALHALPRLGQGAPGLARMQNLMDHLGNPEKTCSASTLRVPTAKAAWPP